MTGVTSATPAEGRRVLAHRHRRARRTMVMAVLLALVLSACGGSTDDGGGSDDASTDEDGDRNANVRLPEDSGEPTPGGELTYYLEAETNGGYCLAEAQLAISGIQVARSIYDTLTAPNAQGEYVPFLAESVEPNADNTQWVITVRDGVSFHDGTPLTAEVVKNNLDAFRGQYPARSSLLFTFVLDNIAAIEVSGERQVTVTTKTPWPALPAFLHSSGRLGIMAQAQLDSADQCDELLIGTGPFQLDSWEKNRQMVLSRNPDYWRSDDDGNRLPYLDTLTYVPLPNGPQRLSAVQSDADGAVVGIFSDFLQIGPIRNLASDGTLKNLESSEYGEIAYLMLNVGAPPFDNKNARLAIAHAINREEYFELRTDDLATQASGPFAPGSVGHVGDGLTVEYDVEAATAAVAAYQQETGQPLTFTITNTDDPEIVKNADLLQQYFEAVGIRISRRTTDQAGLINLAIAGDFQLVQWRNHPGGDPDLQYIWWHSGLPTNFGRIDDPEIDRLLDEGRVTSDPGERAAIYEDLTRRFASELYNLWSWYVSWSIPHSPRVNGVLGPQLPDGSDPFTGLATGHPVDGIWISE